jgi:O-antigen/teichoic acid export membrane protein
VVQSVAVTAVVMSIGLVSGIVAARSLGVEGRGQLAAVIMWPGFIACIAELGLPTAFTYLSASGGRASGELAHSVVPLVAVQSLLQYVVGVPVIMVALAGYSAGTRVTAIVFLAVYAPLYLLVRYLGALNLGEGRIGVYNLARVLIASVYTAALLILLLLGIVEVGAFAAAYAASWLATLAVLLVWSSRGIRRGVFRPRGDLGTARSAWSVGYRTFLGSLAPVDSLQLDVLLTTAILGPLDAGLYFVATSAGAVVRTWGTTLGALSLPRVAAAATRQEALAVMSFYVRVTMALSGVFAAALFIFAGPLLRLVYGEQYVPAQTLVRILMAGMLAASLRYVLGDGLRGLGAYSRATHAEILGWVVGGAALVVLLPRWGANGVAAAVSVSYATTLVAMLGFSRRSGARWSRLLVPTLADVSHGMAVFRWTSASRQGPHPGDGPQGHRGGSRS